MSKRRAPKLATFPESQPHNARRSESQNYPSSRAFAYTELEGKEYRMAKGTIRRLVGDRGYGFIRTEEEADLFFHRNDLVGVAYESLTEGQQVGFEITRTAKGSKAVKVRLIG